MNAGLTTIADGGAWPWLSIAFHSATLLALVALSGMFSGSEAVLFSLTRSQLQQDAASPNPFRRIAARLMREPKQTLALILVGNTAVNVFLYANAYVLFDGLSPWLGAWSSLVAALVSALLVTIGGEAIPKTLGVRLSDRLAPASAALLHVSGFVLRPLSRAIDVLLVEPITRVLFGRKRDAPERGHDLTTDELKSLLEMSRRRGVIYPLESDLLRDVLDLQQVKVRDVMIPRVEVRAYDVDAPPDGLRQLIRETHLKKIPVYDGNIDNIIGLIYAKVLFLEPDRPLREIVMPVRFVPELINCEQLLRHFRETRTQLAIAVDEYGGMAGLVTLEDVLELIVGEIHDPDDKPEAPEIVQVGPDEYDISGRLSIYYWSQSFGLPPLADRVATVGGLVTARLGRPAVVGDRVCIGNLELTATSVHRRRIERLRLRRLTATPAESAP